MTNKSNAFILNLIVSSVLLALVMTGCAPKHIPVMSEAMIPVVFDVNNKHPYSVRIEVFGGWKDKVGPYITNDAYLEAIKTSIAKTGVFSTVTTDKDSDYFLDVVIVRDWYNGKWMTLVTQWELTKVASNNLVWSEIITTSDTSSDDHGRVAFEIAAKDSVKKGIEKIMSLTDL